MQFVLLIYEPEQRWATMNEAQRNSEIQEYRAFGNEFSAAIRGGNALQPTPTAKTVRLRNGKPNITDGPFAETKEQLGGYFLIEARDTEEALRIGARIPGARSGSVEVRSVMTFS